MFEIALAEHPASDGSSAEKVRERVPEQHGTHKIPLVKAEEFNMIREEGCRIGRVM